MGRSARMSPAAATWLHRSSSIRRCEASLTRLGITRFPTSSFTFAHQLGSGTYGVVTAGTLALGLGAQLAVAVKRSIGSTVSDSFGVSVLEVLEAEIAELRARDELLHEAEVAAQISAGLGYFSGVVPLVGLEIGVDNEVSGLVMPLSAGGDLGHYATSLEGSTREMMKAKVEALKAVAEAVAKMHACGWVHADLKELNVVMGANGPQVIDLNMAVQLGSAVWKQLGTRSYGTPDYCDPFVKQEGVLSRESDVYSLGVMMVNMGVYEVGCMGDLVVACLAPEPWDRPNMAEVAQRLACEASHL